MTSFEIVMSPTAERQLDSFHPTVTARIVAKLETIREDPHRWVKRLRDSTYYSLRVGDYRAILDIQGNVWRIIVVKAGHRSVVYER